MTNPHTISRRDFAQLLAIGGTAVMLPGAPPALATPASAPLVQPRLADEKYWIGIREQFLMPKDLAPMNAANLCPSPKPVVDALVEATHRMDRDPSPQSRASHGPAREETRRLIAEKLRATPEEIVITRNTSEANNFVSNGLTLQAGDEVVIFSDNHPSNHAAWREKAARFGYEVKIVEQKSPHPGAEYYVQAFTAALTSRTKVLAITHVTNSAGDLMPAAELCRIARERGVLSVLDGAQTFGVLDVNLSEIRPDFYTASAHKWPCGPKETGILYVNTAVQDRIAASIVSLYAGAVGISRRLEGFGQRDEAAVVAFGEAIRFQNRIGAAQIEARSRELAQALITGLKGLDGVTMWTHPEPARSAAVVTFQPGSLDPRRLAAALYEKDRIVCASRGGTDRPGIRLSPHLYNLHTEVDRAVGAVKRYLASGV